MTSSLCFICDKTLSSSGRPKSKVIQDNKRNNLLCQRFCKLSCRYLHINIDNDLSDLDLDQRNGDGDLCHNATGRTLSLDEDEENGTGEKEVPKIRLCCDNCRRQVKAFCIIYEQWDLMRIQLNQRSKVISQLMDNDINDLIGYCYDHEQLSGRVAGGENGNRRFKEAFISKVKKNRMDFPHLRLSKLGTGNDDLGPAPAKKSKVSAAKQKPIVLRILFDDTELNNELDPGQFLSEEEVDDVVEVNTKMTDNPERVLKRFKCQFCDVKFTRRDRRQEHERRVHPGERVFTCDLCPAPAKQFTKQYQLFEHLDKFHKGGQGSTSQSKVSANLSKAKKQEVTSQMKMFKFKDKVPKIYYCKVCDHPFPDEEAKTKHEASHIKELPYECPICHKRFGRNDHKKRHVIMVHQKGTQEMSNSKLSQAKTQRQRSKVNAETEAGTDEAEPSLALAVIKKENDDDDAEVDDDDAASLPLPLADNQMKGQHRHKCQICGNTFPDEETFSLHRQLNHSSKLRFSCDICGKKFTRGHHVKRHIAGVHQKQKPKRKHTSFVFVGHRMTEDDNDNTGDDDGNGNDVNELGDIDGTSLVVGSEVTVAVKGEMDVAEQAQAEAMDSSN